MNSAIALANSLSWSAYALSRSTSSDVAFESDFDLCLCLIPIFYVYRISYVALAWECDKAWLADLILIAYTEENSSNSIVYFIF